MPVTKTLRKQVVQTGTIESYAGIDIPEGYLLCDGLIVNIADYPRLFEIIGTSWGYGNNDGLTFHLPDLRGKFLRGSDLGAGVDPEAGTRTPNNTGGNSMDNVGTDQGDKTRTPRDNNFVFQTLGNHSHAFNTRLGFQSNGPDAGIEPYTTGTSNPLLYSQFAGAHTHTVSSGGDAESRPINSAVVFIIKYI